MNDASSSKNIFSYHLGRNEGWNECWRDGMWSKTVEAPSETIQMSFSTRSRLSIWHAQLMCVE